MSLLPAVSRSSHPLVPLIPFLLLVPLSGCRHREVTPDPDPPGRAASGKLPEGVVQLSEPSLKFITVEPMGSPASSVEIPLPARVAFLDGAVSQVGAPMAGRVTRVWVRTGDRVRAGDPLVTLASPEAASARTALASARAALREAKAALEREKRMADEGVGTERDRLSAEVRLQEAEAEANRAEATSAFLGDGTGTDLLIRSPLAGSVLSAKTSPGAQVEPGGDPLVEVGDPRSLCVVADATEHDLRLIREGATAIVELPSVSEALTGHVTTVGTVVSAGLRTAPVRVALDQPSPLLRPGMFGRARIVGTPLGSSLPTEAVLIKDGRDTVVYVAKAGGTFERRKVAVGRPYEGRVQVISGLERGESVVVKGALLLDGAAEQLL